MRSKKRKRTTSPKKKLLIALCVVLSIILLALLGVCGAIAVWDDLLGDRGRLEDQVPTYNEDDLNLIDPTDTLPIIDQVETITAGKDVVNILLVGQDRRNGEGRMHSDAIILCTINKKTKTLTMTSFMRDMYVYIPEHYNERINVPYMVGGFPVLNDTLEYNFGVRADYNIEIDFNGFMEAIDLVGGIDIELTQKEANYLNRRGNWGVEDNQGWQLKEGINHLTGSQALAYSRIREIGDDFARTNRQRIVLNTLIEKAKTLKPMQLYELVKGVTPMLTTDMKDSEILGLAVEMLPLLTDLKVVSQRIPADGEYYFANKNGASVIGLTEDHFTANKKLLEEAMKTE